MYEILSRYMYENYFCGVICMIKKISAAAIAVIMSASMMFTTASADASYVLDKDAGEDFVNFIDGKLPDILKSMDSVADGDKTYFDYGSWFMDLDFDGVPEFIIGGEMADGDRHYSILTKDGKEIKIDDTVANGQYFPGFMGFDYMPYRDLYTGEVSYFSSNDKIKTMTFDPEKGVTEKELCSEEYDLETDSTVYKTDGKEVSESEYYNYKSTLSRFIPLEVENTELTSDETAKADADKLLEMYNDYNCVVMTAENKKDDMISVIVEMCDLLKEMMVDVPSEIADDVDWSYNSWFEDLNFDGVPDFVIGGIADLLDEGTALRLYDVIGMGNAGFLADTNVSNDHGDGENGFGFKPYVNKQTGEKTYLSEDRYAEDGKDGKPRELHVNKALDVTKLAPAEQYPETPVEKKDGYDIKLLSKCEYFTTYRVNVETKAELDADENSFNSILVLEGEPVISGSETVSAKKGESVFISAGTGKYTVEGKCTFVLTKID